MIKALFLFLFFLLAASSLGLAEEFVCFRPQDLSNYKAIRSYEACMNKKEAHCERREHAKENQCLPHPQLADYLKRFPSNPEDIIPSERCTIYKDGWYRCLQDPIRFVVKEEHKEPAPFPSQPSENPDGSITNPAITGIPQANQEGQPQQQAPQQQPPPGYAPGSSPQQGALPNQQQPQQQFIPVAPPRGPQPGH